jgi:hypothetical protein
MQAPLLSLLRKFLLHFFLLILLVLATISIHRSTIVVWFFFFFLLVNKTFHRTKAEGTRRTSPSQPL